VVQEVKGFIVLIDISGYTRYIRSHNLRHVPVVGKHFRETSEAHGEQVVTDLLEALINATSDLLHPEKLEGDAVLMTAIVEDQEGFSRLLVARLQDVFKVFHQRIAELVFCTTCLCDCCSNMEELKVKAIAHHGPFLLKKVAGFREIAGQEVIRAHRLLKNTVKSNEYLMLTEPVVSLSEATSVLSMEGHEEVDPDLGPTKVWVHFPENHSALSAPPTEAYLQRLRKMYAYFEQPIDRGALISAAK
jgi:hypothetical protein